MAKEKAGEVKPENTVEQEGGGPDSGETNPPESDREKSLPAVEIREAHLRPTRRQVVCVNCGKEGQIWKTRGPVTHLMCNHCGHNWTGQVAAEEADPLAVLMRELVIQLKQARPLKVPGFEQPVFLLSLQDADRLVAAIEEEIGQVHPTIRKPGRK